MSRLDKTILDYLVIAIIPALIMLLVGSLVFFLLTVFFHGQYVARLHFIFAMFVMATVLIARISMNEGIEYAMLFAIPLAIAAGLAMWRFVAIEGPLAQLSPLINLGLLGLVWWSAHRLTWDCTLIDEHEDATGQGLLQTIGLDAPSPAESQGQQPEKPTEELPTVTSPEAPPRGRWQRFLARQRRPHSPGVWVVYFSLAALPLFGLGQRLILEADLSSRQYAFRLLFVYVASGLGLLLTTSFLGLRRYLRQRRVEMSNQMAKTWLVTGSVMIVLLMAFCTLLPRPAAEYSVSRLPLQFGSPNRQRTSRLAPGHDGPRHQQQAKRAGTGPEQRGSSDEEKSRTESQGKRQQGSEQDEASRQDRDVDPSSRSRPDSSDPTTDDQGRDDSSRSQPDSSDQTTGDRHRDDSSPSTKPSRDQPRQRDPNRQSPTRPDKTSPSKAWQRDQSPVRPSTDGSRQSQPPPIRPIEPGQMLESLGSAVANMLKLMFYTALFVVAGLLLWQYRDRVKAAWLRLLVEIRQFWHRLFAGRQRTAHQTDSQTTPITPKPRPFSDFADPFATGLASRYSAAELIQYTFEALEAWAGERGLPRDPGQTPHEFAARVAAQQQTLGPDAKNLATLYSRTAYAQGQHVPADSAEQLKRLWNRLRAAPKGS